MQLSGIYDAWSIQPICKIKEFLAIWTQGGWEYYKVNFIEPVPPGPVTIVDMVTVAGVANIGANATLAKALVAVLQPNTNEFLHLRWEPIDNVEGVLWEQAQQARLAPAISHCRVDPTTKTWDQYLTTTTFWILGRNRDFQLEVRNPLPVAQPMARFIFFGFKYILEACSVNNLATNEQNKLREGDVEAARRLTGSSLTWVPAEGRI